MDSRHGDFQGRSETVLAVTIAMTLLSTLFVFFRLVSRVAIVKKFLWDDGIIVVAWVIACGLAVAICYSCAWGLGRHEANVPSAWESTQRKANFAFTVLYQPALMALKTSIVVFYLSFATTHRVFWWACIATLVVVNAGGLAITLVTIFQCHPVSAIFDAVVPAYASCTDIVTIFLSSTPLNLITDFAILFLPMPILTSMRLPRKQKIILIITFSFGLFVMAVDVVRIAYLQSASQIRLTEVQGQGGSSSQNTQATDVSYDTSLSYMWSVVEVHVGIVCANVPGLKPLVARFLPKMLRDSDEAPSKSGSLSLPIGTVDMVEAHRIPSVPDDPHAVTPAEVRRQDFGNQSSSGPDGDMGMMDFLTTPDMAELPPSMQRIERTQNDERESLFPIGMVTVLFFIWGFEYGLLDVLNQQFQKVAHMTPGQSTGIHSAYFAGYAVGPLLVGRPALQQWGFKACYSIGLSIFACGTLIYWPAAVLTSFPAFIITNFIVAFGLSILEVAANPFIALCGPSEYAEVRLNISQGVQAVGSVVAPLIANRAFFQKYFHAPSLIDTQWAYLGISLATISLAVGYYYVPLPEATDSELEDASERMDGAYKAKIGGLDIIWLTLGLGVFSQFCYVGGQEVSATLFDNYLAAVQPTYNVVNWMAVAHTAFAASRFLAAALGLWIKPRLLLLTFFLGAILFEALAMNLTGSAGVAMLIMVFFMEGPIFSLIFAQSLRGMGRHTKLASVALTSAVSGGAVFAPISSHLANREHRPMYSLVIAIAAFAAGSVFAFGLNGSAKARAQVDPMRDATTPPGSDVRPGSTDSRASRALSFFGGGRKKGGEQAAEAEWRERKPEGLGDPG
ncbi:hypothetical protein LTR82_000269 [Friedmanniomyces endolithicus]|uniref:Rhodopsin domain-containing protein n=1 Tax=Friedmanniomyces endolithicus TaxID=329885 RepID=A0AAN6JFL8_9PEZI|nr:hypothetical protein LTR82_000269 [Friedmanniomyces endolithicus]